MAVDYEAAALAAARRYCGWRVTPADDETITLDGPGGRMLSVPSLCIVEVTEVVEDGVTLDLADLRISSSLGQIWKKAGCWTSNPGGISVTMNHGLDAAPDFDAAVEQAAVALAAAGTRTDTALKRKKVDDVEHEWFESASSFLNESLLSAFRILPAP